MEAKYLNINHNQKVWTINKEPKEVVLLEKEKRAGLAFGLPLGFKIDNVNGVPFCILKCLDTKLSSPNS